MEWEVRNWKTLKTCVRCLKPGDKVAIKDERTVEKLRNKVGIDFSGNNHYIYRKFHVMKFSVFGGECEDCGAKEELEFAHLKDTGLEGRGRGKNHRYLDIKNNPDSYALLCHDCHETFDKEMDEDEREWLVHCVLEDRDVGFYNDLDDL